MKNVPFFIPEFCTFRIADANFLAETEQNSYNRSESEGNNIKWVF